MIQLAGYTEEEKLADRQALPRAAPDRAQRAQALADRVHRRRRCRRSSTSTRARRRAQPRARDRLGLPQGRAPGRRGHARAQGHRRRAPKVRELLGRAALPRRDVGGARAEPGVATGLAWTPVGGDVLFVEATRDARQGQAHDHRPARRRDEGVGAGRAVLRARARAGRCPRTGSPTHDIHVHVPAGAIPKDGPSAGVTMATALMSLRHRPPGARRHRDDRRDHADRPGAADRRPQGEGAGGAARRASSACIAPRRNEPDLEDIPEHLRKDIEFVWVGEIGEVFDAALDGALTLGMLDRKARHLDDAREVVWQRRRRPQGPEGGREARYNPYVQRLIEDEDLRENIVQAYESGRDAYARLQQRQVARRSRSSTTRSSRRTSRRPRSRSATPASRCARRPKKQRKGGGFGRLLLLGIVGAGVALAVSARACARRCSTRCSAPRRSSSTPRRRPPAVAADDRRTPNRKRQPKRPHGDTP